MKCQRVFLAIAVLSLTVRVASAQIYAVQPSGVVSFDPSIGVVTGTGIPWPGPGNDIYQGESAADLAGRRIFVMGSSAVPGQSTLTTISLSSATVSQVDVSGSSGFIESLAVGEAIPTLHPAALAALASVLGLLGAIAISLSKVN